MRGILAEVSSRPWKGTAAVEESTRLAAVWVSYAGVATGLDGAGGEGWGGSGWDEAQPMMDWWPDGWTVGGDEGKGEIRCRVHECRTIGEINWMGIH